MSWMAAAILGAGALGAYAGYQGQKDTNKANAKQAEKQMRFQEDMDNTKYQRMYQDMQKAGLNPALAYTQGAGSAPAGAMAQMQNPLKDVSNEISGYFAKQQIMSQISNAQKYNDLMSAQEKNLVEVNKNLGEQNKKLQAETQETNARTALIKEQTKSVPVDREFGNTTKTAKTMVDNVKNVVVKAYDKIVDPPKTQAQLEKDVENDTLRWLKNEYDAKRISKEQYVDAYRKVKKGKF